MKETSKTASPKSRKKLVLKIILVLALLAGGGFLAQHLLYGAHLNRLIQIAHSESVAEENNALIVMEQINNPSNLLSFSDTPAGYASALKEMCGMLDSISVSECPDEFVDAFRDFEKSANRLEDAADSLPKDSIENDLASLQNFLTGGESSSRLKQKIETAAANLQTAYSRLSELETRYRN